MEGLWQLVEPKRCQRGLRYRLRRCMYRKRTSQQSNATATLEHALDEVYDEDKAELANLLEKFSTK